MKSEKTHLYMIQSLFHSNIMYLYLMKNNYSFKGFFSIGVCTFVAGTSETYDRDVAKNDELDDKFEIRTKCVYF